MDQKEEEEDLDALKEEWRAARANVDALVVEKEEAGREATAAAARVSKLREQLNDLRPRDDAHGYNEKKSGGDAAAAAEATAAAAAVVVLARVKAEELTREALELEATLRRAVGLPTISRAAFAEGGQAPDGQVAPCSPSSTEEDDDERTIAEVANGGGGVASREGGEFPLTAHHQQSSCEQSGAVVRNPDATTSSGDATHLEAVRHSTTMGTTATTGLTAATTTATTGLMATTATTRPDTLTATHNDRDGGGDGVVVANESQPRQQPNIKGKKRGWSLFCLAQK